MWISRNGRCGAQDALPPRRDRILQEEVRCRAQKGRNASLGGWYDLKMP